MFLDKLEITTHDAISSQSRMWVSNFIIKIFNVDYSDLIEETITVDASDFLKLNK